MFRPVSSRVSFPELEKGIIALWRQNNTFQRSVAAREGGPRFTLYEGPPTANGSPGFHHVISRAYKDLFPRYKTMKGYYAPRIGGWDTHGLPVELEVERELGLTSKSQIEDYGIERFNARCRESVFRYLEDWNWMTERIGFWIDLEHAYITLRNDYIETVWWALKQMWDRDLVYQGYRVTPHCPRCGTSLSSHEVALGYRDDAVDPSVFVKFRLSTPRPGLPEALKALDERPVFLLAWTTTPWTLPGNTALAVAADAEYSVVAVDNEYLILASARLLPTGLDTRPVVATLAGRELVGLTYEPLFNPHRFGVERHRFQPGGGLARQEPDDALAYRVIATEFVSMEDGTGIVHIAPAYGEVDYQAGQEHGLDFVHTVDLQGNVTGSYPFAGRFVKEADPEVLADLEKRGLLHDSGTITHTYPFCWRCDSPLLYYAKQTWYIRTTAVKENLLRGNEQINWYPEYIKHGRFGDWLENNVDWALSRERYWGTPLPVWQCQECGTFECIGGVEELRARGATGLPEPLDLHRPYVDAITFTCHRCRGQMRRRPEVIDCWFDSGAMPIAQYHYPFENATLLEDGRFPADYICEAVDQTRGWFYSLHAISTLLFDRPSYRNVICHGHILDARGEKMSKSRGNVVDLPATLERYGADVLRWYCYTSAPPGNSRRYSEDQLKELTRQFFMTLWNVYSFFVTYANIDRFVPGKSGPPAGLSELDRWILSELNKLIKDVNTALDAYDPCTPTRRLAAFVSKLSNWYVRRSRRRFWKSENDADKLAAHATLYTCLVTLAGLLAPFTPFLAEELYQNLVLSVRPDAPDSVHLTDFPAADEALIDERLNQDTQLAMEASSLGRAARSRAGIKVRQPLARVIIRAAARRDREGLTRVAPQVLEELNVKKLELAEDAAALQAEGLVSAAEGGLVVAIDTTITPELAEEGLARELVHRLQTMRRNAGFDIADYITTWYLGDDYVNQVIASWSQYIRQETLSRGLVRGEAPGDAHVETFRLSGHEVKLAVKRQAAAS